MDAQLGGTSDGQGAATNNGSFSFFEIAHPLNTVDDLNDFSLAPGTTVGFSLGINLSTLIPDCTADCLGSTAFPATEGGGDIVIASSVVTVEVDVKPGSDKNLINLRSEGVIPVAILGSSTFDATTVDPTTVEFAGAPVRLRSNGRIAAATEDLNLDGHLDLLLHFETSALDLATDATEAVLTGRTYGGTGIRGVDTVRIVP